LIPADSHGLTTDSENSIDSVRMPLPRVLRWFWIGSVFAFALMALVNYVEYLMGIPWDVRVPIGNDLFGDLLVFAPAFQHPHTGGFFRSTAFSTIAYPPLGAILYALTYSFEYPVMLYLGIFALWLGVAIGGVRRLLIGHGISPIVAMLFPLTVAVVSFPIEGLVQRGNIELFVWIFAGAGIWAFLRDRDKTAAVLWGLAAAAKLYPVILLVLLIAKLRFKAVVLGLTALVMASALSMAYIGPTMETALERSFKNVFGYQSIRTSEWSVHEFSANHSALLPVRLAASMVGGANMNLTRFYYLCGGVIFLALFFGKVRKMPVTNQVLVVTTFMVIFPPISYFYTLVHLYAPFVMLVFLVIRAERANVRIPGLTGTILLFVPIFAAFMIFTFPRALLFGGMIQEFLLMSVLLCAVQFPFSVEGATKFQVGG
jgi:hypothetical protein